MPQPANANYGDVVRVAFDIWQAVKGPPENDQSPEAVQKSLLVFAECLKAASNEAFDVPRIYKKGAIF